MKTGLNERVCLFGMICAVVSVVLNALSVVLARSFANAILHGLIAAAMCVVFVYLRHERRRMRTIRLLEEKWMDHP